jgi:hypothetical protein
VLLVSWRQQQDQRGAALACWCWQKWLRIFIPAPPLILATQLPITMMELLASPSEFYASQGHGFLCKTDQTWAVLAHYPETWGADCTCAHWHTVQQLGRPSCTY